MDMANDLLCCENASADLDSKCKAYFDPVLLKDDRVLINLLNLEEKYMPNSSYFSCVQTDVDPYMREETAHWMLQVCQEERREEEVFTLAMNMMDRFLSLVSIRRQQLQLLGTVCLFLASKIKESPPLDPHLLAQYTADSITVEEIRKWELLVLTRLKWDLAAITPHAFLDQIIARLQLKLPEAQMRMVREHATFFITVCATDARFTSNPPSMVAAAAVATAVQGMLIRDTDGGAAATEAAALAAAPVPVGGSKARGAPTTPQQYMQELYHSLHAITQIDTDCLKECHRQIEIWTQSNVETPSTSTSTTPTDMQEVMF
ncbi:G1/S-specific cyclin-D2-like [Penaeus japonicus]|uniref:G1/S-specific cyclin-D2-like n=1 Tax=Penaeus japonicus TaxID=27405 RepID=UPI001C711590|nr:G1/S-specific cyclin-D2-like [Penaeus japonicus]